jgi:LruC domain-containing protein
VAGQHDYVGTVDVALDGGDILVTYRVTKPGVYLKEIHLDIFDSEAELEAAGKLKNGNAVPGKFAIKESFNTNETTKTYRILKANLPASVDDCYFIASHAALSNGETAWGGLCSNSRPRTSLDEAKQFPGKNWSVYFEFCTRECLSTIDFTYAWEDLRDNGNDQDYNDLVVQSDITKSPNELKIDFLATARGASYDHSFIIKIPATGIEQIFGVAPTDVTLQGGFYYVTVFRSTKEALPGRASGAANTRKEEECVPFAEKAVTFTINNNFNYDAAKPYEPFIRVWSQGTAGSGTNYDLYIYAVSGGIENTYLDDNNVTRYPNGILIPRDWRWPFEQVSINEPTGGKVAPYASFDAANWFDNPTNLAQTFDKSTCPPL